MQNIHPIEAEIIGAVIEDALNSDYELSVFDGEEWALTASRDRKAVESEIGATDLTSLALSRESQQIGLIHFVHGLGAEVLADHTANYPTNAVIGRAARLAQGLE